MRLLTLARDLTRRRGRERQQLFVCEGVRAVEELLRSPIQVRGAVIAPHLRDVPRGLELERTLRARNVELAEVTFREFASAAATESPQGVLAMGEIPSRALGDVATPAGAVILVLDAVQDPGNVGALIRTAAALGAAATVALPGTVDLWNAKVVRSAMGALFTHHAVTSTLDELDAFRRERGVALWGADAAGTPIGAVDRPSTVALVVGNEGAGLSAAVSERLDQLVSVPIAPSADSLNVAVATGILLHELRT